MGFNLRTLSAYESHLFGQVECHPYFPQVELFNFCQERGVVFSAYSPLGCGDRAWKLEGEPDIFDDPKIQKIAQRLGKSVAQVAIRYACKILKSMETQVCLLSLIIFSLSVHHHYKACLFLFKLIPHNHIHFGYVMMANTLWPFDKAPWLSFISCATHYGATATGPFGNWKLSRFDRYALVNYSLRGAWINAYPLC